MEVSGSGSLAGAFAQTSSMDKVSQAEKPTKTDVAVVKHGLEAQKAEGAQLVDMIQKAGSIIDVKA